VGLFLYTWQEPIRLPEVDSAASVRPPTPPDTTLSPGLMAGAFFAFFGPGEIIAHWAPAAQARFGAVPNFIPGPSSTLPTVPAAIGMCPEGASPGGGDGVRGTRHQR
jgi:hypothetical protein